MDTHATAWHVRTIRPVRGTPHPARSCARSRSQTRRRRSGSLDRATRETEVLDRDESEGDAYFALWHGDEIIRIEMPIGRDDVEEVSLGFAQMRR